MGEKFCPLHGPYDAALDECPYCLAEQQAEGMGLPASPLPLGAEGSREETPEDERGPAWSEEALAGAENTQAGDAIERTLVDRPKVQERTLLGLLWVKAGRFPGKVFPLEDGAVLGRTMGDILLQDPRVSNPHAKVTLEDGRFVLWDFGSANGTWVNGRQIREATPLAENDEIRMGETVLVLKTLSLGGSQ